MKPSDRPSAFALVQPGPGQSLQGVQLQNRQQVTPSSWGFVAWWIGLLILHCANFGYYVGVAKLYNSLQLTYTYLEIQVLSIGIDNSQYPKISAIHATIAAIHAFFILLMIGSSIHARKLVFQPDLRQICEQNRRSRRLVSRFVSPQPHPTLAPAGSAVATHSDRLSSARLMSRRITQFVGRSGIFIFARDGLLGVDSAYFDHIILLRELVETALQTYQVYRMSQLLPRLWLVRFYVALLVINCWAVPLLHRYYRDRETTRRMLCLLCDTLLDMVSSIGVSLIIFGNYVPQYNDPNGFGFPFANWFDDYWLANMQQEFQMMLVASWSDMVSRLVFALGLLQCMDGIKKILTPVPDLTPAAQVAGDEEKVAFHSGSAILARDEAPHLTNVVTPVEFDADNRKVQPSKGTKSTANEPQRSRLQRLVYYIVHVVGPGSFVLWGFGILVVHLIAETHYSDAACGLTLKPWFSSKPGCSIIEINCHDIQSTGQDETIATALDVYDPERAARVVFRHCPALVMTPTLHAFKNMAGLKIYNSTVVAWEDDSAITGTHHKSMRSLFLVRTFFPNGELPPGLLTDDFPSLMIDMVTSVTNLRILPDDLDKKWGRGLQITFEFSQIAAIPDVLVRLHPTLVSFAGCPITTIPAELFEVQSLWAVGLSMTRIHELPRNVTKVSPVLKAVLLHRTNVTTFWSWMDAFMDVGMRFPVKLFSAYDTPYCRELNQISTGSLDEFSATPTPDLAKIMDVSTPEKLAYAKRAVDCTQGPPTYFPLPLEDAKHGLHS